ncbi:MAG: putative exonuclease, partial [Frankiales bacterium]|nr:putative exonuclease [Frankiales bacterium]
GLTAAEAAVAALQRTLQDTAAELARCQAELAEAGRRELEQGEVAETLRARLDRELGNVDLPRRQTEVAALAQAYEVAAEAAASRAAADLACAEADRACREQAAAAGFATPEDAARAARDADWAKRGQSRLDAHTRALAAVRGRLAGDDLAVPLLPAASVPACEARLAEAVRVHEVAVADLRVASERAAALARLVPTWSTACAALPALCEDAARRKGLAELVAGRGGNRLSMPLSTFVLAGRLEEVAAAASLRLEQMSGGRYTLVHSDTGTDKRSRAGLGLQVEDGWTGRRRDTATLSGGETFMTALALALGLADVVTAESGGHSIDALFVDEGFGTLDAQSLDQVMDVLDELRSGGRLVGVVSHVADLRQRIPAQVRVLKGVRGSSVEAGVA